MNKTKGKFILFLSFVLIIGLSLTATAGEDFDWRQFEGETVVVNFPAHLVHFAWAERIPEFEEKTGINVELDQMEYMRMMDRQRLELGRPQGDYDVISFVGPNVKAEFARAGYLTPLEQFIEDPELTFPGWDFDDFVDGLVTVQGVVCTHPDCRGKEIYLGGPEENTELYALPAGSEVSIFAYRKDLFEEHDLDVPETWDEVLEKSRYFHEEVEDIDGLTMRGAAGHQATHGHLNFANHFGADLFSEDFSEILFTGDRTLEVLEFQKKVVEYGPSGIPGFDAGENDNTFLMGDAAMIYDHSRIASMVRDPDQSVVGGKVGYATSPDGPGEFKPETGGFGVGIPSNATNPEAGWLFITWMTSKEVMTDIVDDDIQLVDRHSVVEKEEFIERFDEFEVLQEQIEHADPDWRPAIPEWGEINVIFGTQVNEVLTGAKTPEEAMEDAAETISEILEEAGYN